MTAITDLTYEQPIRLASWAEPFYATVFSVEGYARKSGADPEKWVAMELSRGRGLAASIAPSKAIVGGECGRQYYARERAKAASAVTLAEGDLVRIEGRVYRAKVARGNDGDAPRNSDPIHFVLVEA